MKKALILSLIIILCVGCTRIDNIEDYSIIIDNVIKGGEKTPNTISLGYKYYLPMGISKIYDKDYNQKFKIEEDYLYLYVDAVSYYYQNSLNFNENDIGNYYYQKISSGSKQGYVVIKEDGDRYYLKIIYNYAKVEAYTSKEKLNNLLANSMIILDSIDYNDNLIEKILESEYFSSVDKKYQINKPEDTTSRFSEYLSEYVQDDEEISEELPEY